MRMTDRRDDLEELLSAFELARSHDPQTDLRDFMPSREHPEYQKNCGRVDSS